jgi:hypothetical protein
MFAHSSTVKSPVKTTRLEYGEVSAEVPFRYREEPPKTLEAVEITGLPILEKVPPFWSVKVVDPLGPSRCSNAVTLAK